MQSWLTPIHRHLLAQARRREGHSVSIRQREAGGHNGPRTNHSHFGRADEYLVCTNHTCILMLQDVHVVSSLSGPKKCPNFDFPKSQSPDTCFLLTSIYIRAHDCSLFTHKGESVSPNIPKCQICEHSFFCLAVTSRRNSQRNEFARNSPI